MKTKKHVVALAIVNCMLFIAQPTNMINLNEQTTTEIEKVKKLRPNS